MRGIGQLSRVARPIDASAGRRAGSWGLPAYRPFVLEFRSALLPHKTPSTTEVVFGIVLYVTDGAGAENDIL